MLRSTWSRSGRVFVPVSMSLRYFASMNQTQDGLYCDVDLGVALVATGQKGRRWRHGQPQRQDSANCRRRLRALESASSQPRQPDRRIDLAQ